MDARQERGRVLANDKRIKRIEGATWFVPSQTGISSGYIVNLLARTCSCPDHETRAVKCKHMFALELSQVVEIAPDGSATVTETIKVRKTYGQDWPKYNRAQCEEKATVQQLLHALCAGIEDPPQAMGRPRHALSDVVYAMTMKTYTTASGRRATTDIEACADKGHMTKAPRYNSTFDYFGKPEMTPLLTALVEESARPLASIESQFAADSTGFGTTPFDRWYDAKYGREKKMHGYVKAHAMIGTVTNVVTAITVTHGSANDCPEFVHLVAATADNFTIKEVSADKAYLSHANLKAVEGVGGVPFIPFKSNSQGSGSAAWRRAWGLFMYRREEFLACYHRRSNVEATFGAIKAKFGGSLRSKNPTSQVNEVLCKVLCFNLSMVVHAMHELGVEPEFRATVQEMAS